MQYISSNQKTYFHQAVISLVNNSDEKGDFIFKVDAHQGAVKSLRNQSNGVADVAGLYFVFIEHSEPNDLHSFIINQNPYSLIYFGKAGQKSDGTHVKQKLKGRINNVVSVASRNLKDINRGEYWKIILDELSKDKFLIVWMKSNESCVSDEKSIYDALNQGNLEYPYLNKRLGRPNLSSSNLLADFCLE